jgi:hypothetical protein
VEIHNALAGSLVGIDCVFSEKDMSFSRRDSVAPTIVESKKRRAAGLARANGGGGSHVDHPSVCGAGRQNLGHPQVPSVGRFSGTKKRRSEIESTGCENPGQQRPNDVGVLCRRLCRAYLCQSPLTGLRKGKQAVCQFWDYSLTG